MTDHLNLETKYSAAGEEGSFEGLASVFGQEDMVGDIVAPGAFKRTLREHRSAGRMPTLLWAHNPAEVIGKFTSISETKDGLLVKGRLNLATQRGAEARALMLDDCLSGLSIGFRTKAAERRKNGRTLTDIDLVECSLVSMPCAPNARVRSIKSNGGRRLIPMKGSPMPDDIDDGAVETAAAEFTPQFVERIEAVESKAGAVDEIATRLDKIETKLSRPSARIEVRDDKLHLEKKAFDQFLRSGPEHMGELERKILTAGSASPQDGGYWLVPETFTTELMKNLVEISPMRQVARVQQVSGNPVLLPKRTANLTAGWVAETVEHGLSEPAYAQQSIPVFEARVSVEISNQLLEDAAFNMAAELAQDFAEEFARLEGEAFVRGNGTTQPEGFLTSGDFETTAGGATLDADDVIGLFYSIPARYAANGTWLLRRETIGAIRQFRSAAAGPYVWADTIAPGQPATLLGRPVLEMPGMHAAGGSPAEVVAAFGDWNRAYRIFDRVGLEVLRDPYSRARNSIVTFHARKRVGAALVDGAAVKALSQ